LPAQAVWQHLPSTQAFDEHWFPAVQSAPFPFLATQVTPMQKAVALQSVSTEQPWRQPSTAHCA
jgi:hypothetical protein